jgi:hypothetical protein
MNDLRLHHTPRTGSAEIETPDILIPALGVLRKCRTSLDVFLMIESVPDELLPALAWAASRKRYLPRVAVETLIKACGFAHLERGLGRARTRELMTAFGGAPH